MLHVQWNPVRKGSLALCCGSRGAYTWSDEWVGENGVEEEMAECIGIQNGKNDVPSFLVNVHRPRIGDFDVKDLKWAPDGKGFALLDKDQFCCAFEIEEKES